MTFKSKLESIISFLMMVVVSFISVQIGYYRGFKEGKSQVRQSAVKAGVAQVRTNYQGVVYFRWRTYDMPTTRGQRLDTTL